jgi:hypothetical protein
MWELVHYAPNGVVTKRFPVPGGWIYTISVPAAWAAGFIVSSSFVPFP